MSAKVLTQEAAVAAGLVLVEGDKGRQAVHDVVVALRANRRSGTACAKKRDEVNLSGKKPWRQKGTGRARAGDSQSPIWVGGGVVFGPRPRDYSKKTPKKVRRLALRKALTDRIAAGDVVVVDGFKVDQPKTKDFVKLLEACGAVKKTLIIGASFDETTFLAARNYQDALLARASDVNTEQLLLPRRIVVTSDALTELARRSA